MHKTCKTCAKEFEVRKEDLAFYEQMKVPVPGFCPDCRLLQRLVWRNEKTLYRRECDMCKKAMISIYAPDSPYTIYCRECFHSDNWDPLSYGSAIDFSRPFLEQFQQLQLKVPRLASFVFQNIQSEYVNGAAFNKNCYMMFVSDYNEDSFYSYATFGSHASSDLLNCSECEMCYESSTCTKCYKTFFSEDCSGSQNLLWCKNCTNCQDCIGCVNLKNARYGLFNAIVSKEEYEKARELLASRQELEKAQEKSHALWRQFPVKYFHGMRNIDVTGDYVSNSKNSKNAFDSDGLEDSSYINHGHEIKNSQDSYVLVDKSEKAYQVVSGIALNNTMASQSVWHGYDIAYSDTCENSHDIFGCVGLRKKEYCILNCAYSKEEYEKRVAQLIEHMKSMPYKDAQGIEHAYGDFFPPSFSPFAYNETVAQEYAQLEKNEALGQGFQWKDGARKNYQPTIRTEDMPDTIKDASDSITKEVIECAHKGLCEDQCTTAFKITPDEFALYQRLGMPLPTLCFNCRHAKRIYSRNPRALWKRSCSCTQKEHANHRDTDCAIEFQTSYSPDRKEIVYCEACYQQEVA
jgi:hypothetical protein